MLIFGPKLSPVTITSRAELYSASVINLFLSILPRITSLLFLEANGFRTGFTRDGVCNTPASSADSAIDASEKSFPK